MFLHFLKVSFPLLLLLHSIRFWIGLFNGRGVTSFSYNKKTQAENFSSSDAYIFGERALGLHGK